MKFQKEQRRARDIYTFWRQGRVARWSQTGRTAIIRRLKPRTVGAYDGTPELVVKESGPTMQDYSDETVRGLQGEEDWYQGTDIRLGNRKRDDRVTPILSRNFGARANEAVNLMAATTRNSNLRFVKILGKGGNGVAALFSAMVANTVKFYVMKTFMYPRCVANYTWPDHATLRRNYLWWQAFQTHERTKHRRFIKSMHFVQIYERPDGPQGQMNLSLRNRVTLNQAQVASRRGALAMTTTPVSRGHDRKKVNTIVVPAGRPRRNFGGAPLAPKLRTGQHYVPKPPTRRRRRTAAAQTRVPPYTEANNPTGFPITHGDYIFMEYLRRGDLEGVIIKLDRDDGRHIGRPPNRVLWNIWMCFLRMMIGMDYPCRSRAARLGQNQFGPLEPEIDDSQGGTNPPENRIHFDIDPQNILIGDFLHAGIENPAGPPPDRHADPHHYVPCLKLGDFGAMELWDVNNPQNPANNFLTVQETRLDKSKERYRTPEQFTKEWEWVQWLPGRKDPNNPNALAPGVPAICTPVDTAGLYTWKTNLYQFALTMYCLLTKRSPPRAPVATKIRITTRQSQNAQAAGPHVAAVRTEAYTYGGYLLNGNKFRNVDKALRQTIVLCLCEKPADRPSWQWLYDQAADKLAYYAALDEHDSTAAPGTAFPHATQPRQPPSERADGTFTATRQWSETVFGDPPLPLVRDAAGMQQWITSVNALVDNTGQEQTGFRDFPVGNGALLNVAWLP